MESGIWPVFRWNGSLERGKRLSIDFEKKITVDEFIKYEQRFMSLETRDKERFQMLKAKLEKNVDEVWNRLQKIKEM